MIKNWVITHLKNHSREPKSSSSDKVAVSFNSLPMGPSLLPGFTFFTEVRHRFEGDETCLVLESGMNLFWFSWLGFSVGDWFAEFSSSMELSRMT